MAQRKEPADFVMLGGLAGRLFARYDDRTRIVVVNGLDNGALNLDEHVVRAKGNDWIYKRSKMGVSLNAFLKNDFYEATLVELQALQNGRPFFETHGEERLVVDSAGSKSGIRVNLIESADNLSYQDLIGIEHACQTIERVDPLEIVGGNEYWRPRFIASQPLGLSGVTAYTTSGRPINYQAYYGKIVSKDGETFVREPQGRLMLAFNAKQIRKLDKRLADGKNKNDESN